MNHMTPAEVIRIAKMPGRCFAYVAITDDDGVYIEVKKADLIFRIKGFAPEILIRAKVQDGNLYLN